MSSHLVRRGGVWWTRLVVPERLRHAAGRREFNQSCRTHELAIAKLVAATLLADWRLRLLRLDARPMPLDILKLVDGSPVLAGGGWMSLAQAADISGIGQDRLLRAAADGTLRLFCRLPHVQGHVVPFDALDPVHPEDGRAGGVVVPPVRLMPASAVAARRGGVMPVFDSADVAGAVLTLDLKIAEVLLFEVSEQPGVVFAPDETFSVDIGRFEVLTTEVDDLRRRMAENVPTGALVRAQELQRVTTAETAATAATAGKKAHLRFSDAVEAYASDSSGLPHDLASAVEQRQRKRGLLVFGEFMGDMVLSEIGSDTLRSFRDGPLQKLPAKANSLPKALWRATMPETIQAIEASGVEWPRMSRDMKHERVRWLSRLFAWLFKKEWIGSDPALSLRGETGLTKIERNKLRQGADDADDEGRGPFEQRELKAIFGQSWFVSGNGAHFKRPRVWYPFEFWLPLLGLYAGCRIKEASQLHLSDVREYGSGGWCLDINQNTHDKSLKNEQSKRIVPLHSVLIELGFVDYCDRLKKAGYQRVFPELTWAKSDAKYAKESGRKMSHMLQQLGMPRDSTHVFHCLRHNMNNALIRVPSSSLPFDEGLKNFIRYTLMGHKPGDDVNVRHYTKATPKETAALVNMLDFGLPKIAKFDIEFGLGQVMAAGGKKSGSRHGREDMGPLNPG